MSDVFRFDWPVDQFGYEVIQGETRPWDRDCGHNPSRGGPLHYYRPMDDHAGLWRQFAEDLSVN